MIKQPEIVGDIWFNIPHKLTPEELNGKVVLVDFFTYSCVNCIRTIPHLKKWWERYKESNFIIIGVHTPEFDFEKNPENVAKALGEMGIRWPVVLDNDYVNWNNYANHYWPAKYLFDQNGYLVYEHFGEGDYNKTEEKIQQLLKADFGDKAFPPVTEDKGTGGVCIIPTPELYCGYLRGRLANQEGYHMGHLGFYNIDINKIPDNMIALRGNFNAMPEYIESFDQIGTLYVHFEGFEVNLVMAPATDKLASVHITLDEKTVPLEISGNDLSKSDVIISEPRMYNLIKSKTPVTGILGISALESDFRAYAFTFSGSCVSI